MEKERRKVEQGVPEDFRSTLTPAQANTLAEVSMLGWNLLFVRHPLFQDPVPVVCNAKFAQIGVIDPDGRIDINSGVDLRTDVYVTGIPEGDGVEERRTGLLPVPENPAELLNDHQLLSLQQIEAFGWKIHFMRRAPRQDPVVVIASTDGNRFATLEPDGRIDVNPHLELREAAREEATGRSADPSSAK